MTSTSSRVEVPSVDTSNWRGGPTWVGEQGPELVDLPSDSKVYPHQQSMAMLQQTLAAGSSRSTHTETNNAPDYIGKLFGVSIADAEAEAERRRRRSALRGV